MSARDRATEQQLRAAVERQHGALVVAERRLRDAHMMRDDEVSRMQMAIAAEQDGNGELRTQLLALGDENHELRMQILAMGDNLAAAEKIVRRVDESVTWQTIQRLRRGLYRVLGGERSLPARAFSWGLRSLGGLLFHRPRRSPAKPQAPAPLRVEPRIDFSVFDEPSVSLIIPLYSGAELTRACLESIRDNATGVSYEVILVDDDADQETKQFLARIQGATVIVNEHNIGYLRSINRGASFARGRWLVLCNNDIRVQPGWLSAMMACAESGSDIGIVTPKYVYPDGRLNEAGSIIWRDGTGANYGRGDDPQRPAYNYRRQVDFGSAAALLVRADLFSEIGGYDERYVPMYYEDVDLCFQVRQRGMRVMYEPEAVVVHVEGGTAGTDPASGHKRHQEENRVTFVSKWSDTLDSGHLRPPQGSHRPAADRLASGHVLVIDDRVPTSDRDAGSLRMTGMIRALQELGFQVTFIPDNGVGAQPYTRQLQRMGVEVLHGSFDVSGYLTSDVPLLRGVVLSRPTVGARWLTVVRELAPAATVVYDTVDLHWIREARGMAVSGSGAATAAKVSALRELELAMVRATDATLVTTDVERRTLEREVPGARLHIVPMLHDIAEKVPRVAARSGIIFLGNFGHPPNTDAARQLVEAIMPHVWRRLPDVSVTIVGPDPPPEVLSLQQPFVEVTGWVDDVEPLLHASRLMVAPLRFGAGLKGKVTQSLALGLPVVTTAIGAEGLETGEEGGLLVAEEPAELAERIIEAYTDDELWQHLSSCGQATIARTCSPAIAYHVFGLLLSDGATQPAHAAVA